MNIYDEIETLEGMQRDAYTKLKVFFEEHKPKGQLRDHLKEELERHQAGLAFFDRDSSPLIFKDSKRMESVKEGLRELFSQMSQADLVDLAISQELKIWNLSQTLNFVTKTKRDDNKKRLNKKIYDYESGQNKAKGKNEKFTKNREALQEILDRTLEGLGRKPIPSDFKEFKIRAERRSPEYVPKPRELKEDKLLPTEDREYELGKKKRETFSDSTLRSFWSEITGLPATTKKPSSHK